MRDKKKTHSKCMTAWGSLAATRPHTKPDASRLPVAVAAKKGKRWA